MSKWLISCLLILSVAPFGRPAPELSDSEARAKAIAAVNKARDEKPDHKLYTQRLERFEDEFFEFDVNINKGSIGKGVFIYEVSEAGCDPVHGAKGARACTVVMDADPRWHVAVGRESGSAFRLSGFADSTAEFNRMATELHVHIATEQQAQGYALFFLALHLGPETSMHGPSTRIVRSPFELKQIAEQDFRWCYSDPRYEAAFAAWWRRFKVLRPRPSFEAKSVKRQDGYEVFVPVLKLMRFTLLPFKRMDEEPVLEEVALRISVDAQVQVTARRAIFPRNSR